jgi:hypothetical protein
LLTKLEDDLDGQVTIPKSISRNPLSASTITDVRDWLRHCEDERDSYHKICSLSERAYVPTRLIRISGPLDQLQLRIVCGDDMGEHDMSRYVALSYCWGGDQTHKLTQENHGLYKKNITWESLPRAIQDAAKTAQVLGFHYIWIDSMCIIQDSKDDKEAEISQMTKVYAHATLTVVNKRGDRVTEGFLHPASYYIIRKCVLSRGVFGYKHTRMGFARIPPFSSPARYWHLVDRVALSPKSS